MKLLLAVAAGLLGVTLPALAATTVRLPAPDGVALTADLARPSGKGPFPAVAIFHSCLGPPQNHTSLADAFARLGDVALFVDEFSARGLKDTCQTDFPEGIADARAALTYLGGLPFVDHARLAVVGSSQGGDIALAIAAGRAAMPRGVAVKAVVAFYPPCSNFDDATLTLPTLILIGADDDVTPAADCLRLQGLSPGEVKVVVFSGARHLFDDPAFAGGRRLLGMWLEYDHDAAQKSWSDMRAFLAQTDAD